MPDTLSLIILSERQDQLADFTDALKKEEGVRLLPVATFDEAVRMAAKLEPALIIIDEQVGDLSGMELVRRLLKVNAFINTAVFSSLTEEDFHCHSEGLGILARLSFPPDNKDAHRLLDLLRPSMSLLQPK